jgi:hypothetical protein
MIIRKECLGLVYNKTTSNGCNFKGVVNDNPDNFELYKILDLDVFEKNIPPKAEVKIAEEIKPKKKKKDLDVTD